MTEHLRRPSQPRRASLTGAHGENVIDRAAISIVRAGSNSVWTGFQSIPDALRFKAENGLDHSWRVSDKRGSGPEVCLDHDRPEPVADTMLLIGSMIRDHAMPLVAHLGRAFPAGAAPFPGHDLTAFAATLLFEQGLAASRDPGRWTAVKGRIWSPDGARTRRGGAWLRSDDGHILDLAATGDPSGLAFGHAESEPMQHYIETGLLHSGADSPMVRIWRAEIAGPEDGETIDTVGLRLQRLRDRIDHLLSSCDAFPSRQGPDTPGV
ncbi:hypothetical protein [Defluviimonas salinarum]|uniref:Uncharacterized protein n=1 Tax=Defluviimonas salinarum TaxID=2992147 RepID=A0ABT3J5J0_9RHOB|nr:hypothetical protein [Defluviimonas salinarum]MCW3782939.1 hypothetical protein [Defluviimonas salinarum]